MNRNVNATSRIARTMLMSAVALNVTAGVGAIVAAWWHVGLTRLHVVGAYRDLDTRGVIDHNALELHFGTRLAGDWWLMATEYLTGNQLNKVLWAVGLLAVVLIANTCLCVLAMRSIRPLSKRVIGTS